MAVGFGLMTSNLRTLRPGKEWRGNGGPMVRHQGELIKVRGGDMTVKALMAANKVEQYLTDIIAARKGDRVAIERLRQYETAIQLPGENEVVSNDLPFQVVQKICQADIGRLIGQKIVVGDSAIVIVNPSPDNFTFTFTAKYQAESRSFFSSRLGKENKVEIEREVSAKIVKEGIEIDVPDEENRGPIGTFNPNDVALTLEWTAHFQAPTTHSFCHGYSDYVNHSERLKIDNLNLRAIVMGLLSYVVDNSYLVG